MFNKMYNLNTIQSLLLPQLYSTHQSTIAQNVTHPTLGARGSGIASAFVDVPQQQAAHHVPALTASQLQQVRMNGTGSSSSGYDSLARKKPRRST